jgi:hypothetical protein
LWKYIGELSEHDINRITHLNAMKHFSFDPFSVIPKEQATVKALREQAAGHDVSIRATRTGPITHHTLAADLGSYRKDS